MTNSIRDIHLADVLLVTGSNTTEAHPVISLEMKKAVRKRGAKLILIDPREIELANFAALHIRPRSGTDVAILNAMANILIAEGIADKEFIASRTENYEALAEAVKDCTPQWAEDISGVPANLMVETARVYGQAGSAAIFWAMGITQSSHGVDNVQALANLALLTGNFGKPGSGVNPLRGQNNVQGACDMGGLPNVYPAYQAVTSEEVRAKFEKAWGATANTKVGLTVTEMMPGILEDKIEALYILGEDPIMSDPDTKHIRHCLEELDFFVLQEIFPSETAVYADVLLPGVSFAEKTGTFTNTERRVQMVNKAIEPLGDSRPDWWITAEIAKRMIFLLSSDGDQKERRKIDMSAPWAKWDYKDTSAIMSEVNALTPSYGGITHERLLNGKGLQWPCPAVDHPGTPILHTKQFARGKGKFMPIDHVPPAEKPDDDYPMVMSTGRVLYHWHGGEMTRRAKGLMEVYGQALVELNPTDAEHLGVNGNKTLRITSRRGSIVAQAWVTDRVPPGMVYANFHFPEASANELTHAALDPVSKIPEYKVCAVKVELI